MVVPPSLKFTEPVGVPTPGETAVTVAVKVTEFPATEGLSEEVTVLWLSALLTVNVKLCVAFGNTPLLAVMVMVYVASVPSAGVPLRAPAELSVTPLGSEPVSVKVGAGTPVAATVNDPGAVTVNDVLFV